MTTMHPHHGLRKLDDSSARDPRPRTRHDVQRKTKRPQCLLRSESSSLCNSDASPTRIGIRADVSRSAAWPTSTSLMLNNGVGRGQRKLTAHGASSVILNTEPCTAAIAGCEMRAGALIAFWKLRGWARITNAQRYRSVCGHGTCTRPTLR